MSKEPGTDLAVVVVEEASPEERVALGNWATALLAVRESDKSKFQKARAAVRLSLSSKVVIAAVKIAARKTKKIGWDDRSSSARWGIAGAGLGLALFGGQSAGIAALGTAIGLPLWIVIGAGASFARALVSEVTRRGDTNLK